MTRFAMLVVCVSLATAAVAACDGDGDSDGDAAPTDDATEVMSLVNFNLLHGLYLGGDACPEETASCQAETRLDMMWELIETEADCPDVIALQEVAAAQVELIPPALDEVCDGKYELASELENTVVEPWVLSSLPVLDAAVEPIAGAARTIQWIRFDTDAGPVDFYTTHFVAGIDNFDCTTDACSEAVARDVCDTTMDAGQCNPHETLDFVDRTADPDTPTILAGDLNAEPGEERILTLTDAGFVDVWDLAELPECDPDTGEYCTSSQSGDGPYDGLDVSENLKTRRIDLVLVKGSPTCEPIVDEEATGLFAATAFEPARNGVYWPSDHAGVVTTIFCA